MNSKKVTAGTIETAMHYHNLPSSTYSSGSFEGVGYLVLFQIPSAEKMDKWFKMSFTVLLVDTVLVLT